MVKDVGFNTTFVLLPVVNPELPVVIEPQLDVEAETLTPVTVIVNVVPLQAELDEGVTAAEEIENMAVIKLNKMIFFMYLD